jgi:diguanylate cyclase (GGDEF)-like protein
MARGSKGARILVVDDSRFDRELARDALAGLAEVECVDGGPAALAALRGASADLVISDLTMPGLSGLELLERVLREHPGTDFIMLTANASVQSAVEALRMGAVDYLCKPIGAEQLALVVRRTLDRRHLLHENVRLRDLLSTVDACRALAPCLEPGEIYPAALDIMLGALKRTRGIAVFHRSASLACDGFAFRGLDEHEAARLQRILVGGKRLDLDALPNLEISTSGPLHEPLRGAGLAVGRLLVVPIEGRESERGVLGILEDGQPFHDVQLERIRIVAGHAEVALRNAERYHQAKERALVDDVTSVYNARYLFTALKHEIQRSERYGTNLVVLFLDLDRFKLVNDRHGHLVGSRTLRRLAEVLAQCIRQVDTLARYGGDEFTILLTDTDLETGLLIAERIRSCVAEQQFETNGRGTLRLTLSVGVAAYPRHGHTPETLLDTADKAMYRAKSLGRNRVCSASELEG